MPSWAVLLAQCFNPADCDIPHTLPWWMAAAAGALRLALVAGIVFLVRHLLRARAQRRRPTRRVSEDTAVELYRASDGTEER